MPFAYVSLAGYGVIRFGRYLDTNLKAKTRNAHVDYPKKGGLKDTSKALINVAADTVDLVFGACRKLLDGLQIGLGRSRFYA